MSYIQASKVVKMMKESGIIDKGGVSKKDVDILFAKVNKSKPNMYFEDFVKLLFEISQVKYSIDPTEAFRALLHDHIFPQWNAIIGVKHKTREIKENKLVTKIFNSIINILNGIYQAYFTFKIKKTFQDSKQEHQRCEKSLFEFLRDFEIFPMLVNKSKVYNLWIQITEKSNEGRTPIYGSWVPKITKNFDSRFENSLFSFGFFLDFIALLAMTAYIEDESTEKVFQKVSIPESVVLLLERMELSRGFSNFEEKLSRTHSAASSLLPPQTVIQQVIGERERNTLKTTSKAESITTRSSQLLWNDKKEPTFGENKEEIKEKVTEVKPRLKSIGGNYENEEVFVDCSEEIAHYIPKIKKIFQYYWSFGEPTNTTKLKRSMFVKFLKDADIVK